MSASDSSGRGSLFEAREEFFVVILAPNGDWHQWARLGTHDEAVTAIGEARAEYPHHRFALRLDTTKQEWLDV